MTQQRGPKSPLTAEHKAAMTAGRADARALRRYLKAMRAVDRRNGRGRDIDTLRRRVAGVEAELVDQDDAMIRLRLLQERRDLHAELEQLEVMPELEDSFVAIADRWGQRHGIERATWREFGVPAAVLDRANITN